MTTPIPLGVRDAIIEDLSASDDSLPHIAQKHRLTSLRLTRWAAHPDTLDILAQLRRLSDTRTTLAVARARVAAAHALHRLALDTDNPETARRACVDLLKLDLTEPPQHGAPDAPTHHTPSHQETESIRQLLDRLDAMQPPQSAG